MSEHCASIEELSAYLDGELPAREAWRVRVHLGGCSSCRKRMEGMRELSKAVRALPNPQLPKDFRVAVAESGLRAGCMSRPAMLGWHPWHLVPLSIAAALTLSIGVLLGNALVAVQDHDTPPSQHPMALFDLVPPGGLCIGLDDCYRKGAVQ